MSRGSRLIMTVVIAVLAGTGAVAQPLAGGTGFGVGVRTGLNDSTALVLVAALPLTRGDLLTVSFRPALLVASTLELRTAVTLDLPIDERFRAYAGGGVAYNHSGSGSLDPMLAIGGELIVIARLGFGIGLNHLIGSGNGDTEFVAMVSYRCGWSRP